MYGAAEPVASEVEGAVLLSPPLHRATDVHLKEWAEAGKPLKVLVPEHDDYLQPAAAAASVRAGAAGAGGGGRRRQAPVGGGEVRRPGAQRNRGRGHPRQCRIWQRRNCACRRNGTGRSPRHTPEPPTAQRINRTETGQPHRGPRCGCPVSVRKSAGELSAAVLAGDEDFLDQQHDGRRGGNGDQGSEHAQQAAAGDDRDDGDGARAPPRPSA